MAILSCHVSIKLPPKISDGQRNSSRGSWRRRRLAKLEDECRQRIDEANQKWNCGW